MRLKAYVKDGIQNLIAAKLRALLALLGILVGTASVVAMVSGGQLATHEALQQFASLGTDLLAVSLSSSQGSEDNRKASTQNLNIKQAQAIITADKNILAVAPYTQLYGAMRYVGRELNGSVLGVTAAFAEIAQVKMAKGRFISPLDHYENFCVIGSEIYESMKKITWQEPLGQQIQIDQTIFTIIGVAKPWIENSFVYTSIDNAVLVPVLASLAVNQYAVINNILLRVAPHANIDLINLSITRYMNDVVPGQRLYLRSAKELIAKMEKQSQILTIFLGLIGSIALIVGGIGVMNIMLVSVMERRREIGIRLAVGATRQDIRWLFLIEAILLALVGGILGIIIGICIAYGIAWYWHWQFTLFLLPPLIGFIVSAGAGIFFGFYPAHQASRLDPIIALRAD